MQDNEYPVVCFGEVLWDILPSGALPGGAPMNVAYHLKKLGTHPALITKIGRDQYGRNLQEMMQKAGVDMRAQVDNVHSTGLVHATEGANHEMSYDIVFPSAWDFIEWDEHYVQLVSKAEYFVFGTLALRHKVSRDTLFRLMAYARRNVLDINLRPPHFTRELIEQLLPKVSILKMNSSELDMVAGWFGQEGDEQDRTNALRKQFNIDTIIVTRGGDGAVVNSEGAFYSHPGYRVEVQDTIGSGDSFLAGFLSARLKGGSVEKALDVAARVGALVATKAGGCPEYGVAELKSLNFD